MTQQRFLPDVTRTRRVVGLIMLAPGMAILAWLIEAAVHGINSYATATLVLLFGGGLTALSAWLAFKPSVVIEVDTEGRRYKVLRRGAQPAGGPLDALGPLTVVMRTRVTGTSSNQRSITEFVVHAAVHSKIDLYSVKTSGRARQKMEKLARAWGLPCQSYGGEVRAAFDLDKPLHERLSGDAAARKSMPLPDGCEVRIEELSPGFALVSRFRSWAPLQTGLVFLAIGLFPLYGMRRFSAWSDMLAGDLEGQVLFALIVGFALIVFGKALLGARDTFAPGSVLVTPDGVRYRWGRMRFSEIEEITATYPIEIVGDRRIITLAPSFCPPSAQAAVVHELQRLIIEVGSRS